MRENRSGWPGFHQFPYKQLSVMLRGCNHELKSVVEQYMAWNDDKCCLAHKIIFNKEYEKEDFYDFFSKETKAGFLALAAELMEDEFKTCIPCILYIKGRVREKLKGVYKLTTKNNRFFAILVLVLTSICYA